MNAIGIIFSNIHDYVVPELTRRRAIASIPFCGRYRMIDFELSNMVNSDITKVGVITNYNYQSLMDHIGTGKDWDLARRSGGKTRAAGDRIVVGQRDRAEPALQRQPDEFFGRQGAVRAGRMCMQIAEKRACVTDFHDAHLLFRSYL